MKVVKWLIKTSGYGLLFSLACIPLMGCMQLLGVSIPNCYYVKVVGVCGIEMTVFVLASVIFLLDI